MPSISASSAPGICSAMKRAPSIGQSESPLRCTTRVGTEIAGRTFRMSTSAASSAAALAIPGLAERRW